MISKHKLSFEGISDKFKNNRNELLDNLDEWYNISSKWVNKINK